MDRSEDIFETAAGIPRLRLGYNDDGNAQVQFDSADGKRRAQIELTRCWLG